MSTNNNINKNLPRPLFYVRCAGAKTDITGDGTVYKVAYDSVTQDLTSSFNIVTYTFTAPTTGKYHLQVGFLAQGLLAAHTASYLNIVTTARTYSSSFYNIYQLARSSGSGSIGCSAIADMTAGDTAYVNVCVSNGTKVVDTGTTSWFSGALIR